MGPDGDAATNELRATELELVASLYRALGQNEAFDLLVEALHNKIELSDRHNVPLGGDAVLSGQLDQVQNQIETEQISAPGDPMQRAVEEVASAAILIDERGRQVVANEGGRRLFGLTAGAHFSETLLEPQYQSAFRALLLDPQSLAEGEPLVMRLGSPLGDGADGDCLEIIRLFWPEHGHSFFALRMLDIPWSDEVQSTLQRSFALTAAECDVARGLFRRQTIVAVAQGRGTSVETVKKQVQSILAKTGAQSRTDLVRLTSMISARSNTHKRSAISAWEDPLGRQKFFTRSDGKQMAYTWMGAPGGRDVMMLHGQSIGYLLPERAESILHDAGIRLLIPSRPGFGESDFDTSRTAIDENVDVLEQFCDAMNLRKIPVVGIHGGVAVAMALSLQRCDIVRQIIGLGYPLYAGHPMQEAAPTHEKVVLRLTKHAPKLLSLLVGIGFRNLRKHGPDWYLTRLFEANAADKATYYRGHDLPLIRQAALHLLRGGPAAYTRELQLVQCDWPADLKNFHGEVHFLISEFDSVFTPHSFTEALGTSNRVTVEIAKGAGELLLYQQAELVARTIVQRIAGAD